MSLMMITKEQLKFLKEMDEWLSKEPWQKQVQIGVAMQVRELITKIENKGYYFEAAASLLNHMREEYIKHKKKNKQI